MPDIDFTNCVSQDHKITSKTADMLHALQQLRVTTAVCYVTINVSHPFLFPIVHITCLPTEAKKKQTNKKTPLASI